MDKGGTSSEVEFGGKKVEDDENCRPLDDSFKPATLHNPSKRPSTGVASPQTKRARKDTLDSDNIFDTNDGEACADPQAMPNNTYDSKLNENVLHQAKATTALRDLTPEIRSLLPSSVLIELEATISQLTQNNKEISSRCASYVTQAVALKGENKKTKEQLMVAHNNTEVLSGQCASYENQVFALEGENKKAIKEVMVARSKENELETSIACLTCKNKVFSDQCAFYESLLVVLKAENKKTKEEFMVARNKEKELEASFACLRRKNEVYSDQCASYESLLVALKVKNKKTKEKLILACNKEKELEAFFVALCFFEGFSDQCALYENLLVALKIENKKKLMVAKEKLMVARNAVKELETSFADLIRKNRVFSDQCASYESLLVALKAENKKSKEKLMDACNKEKELEASIARLRSKNKVFFDQCASYENQIVALKADTADLTHENKNP